MTLYSVAVAIHVLAAVLAVGLVGAIPITARLARQANRLADAEGTMKALLRAVQAGLGVMLLSGVLLDVSASGAFHKTGWFKASMVAIVVLGALLGQARGAIRRGALHQMERWGWAMCTVVALITVLMQAKPL